MASFDEDMNNAWHEFLAEREAAGHSHGWNPRTAFEAGYMKGTRDA